MRPQTGTYHKTAVLTAVLTIAAEAPHECTPGALIPLTRLRNRVVIERIREHMALALRADNDLSRDHSSSAVKINESGSSIA